MACQHELIAENIQKRVIDKLIVLIKSTGTISTLLASAFGWKNFCWLECCENILTRSLQHQRIRTIFEYDLAGLCYGVLMHSNWSKLVVRYPIREVYFIVA